MVVFMSFVAFAALLLLCPFQDAMAYPSGAGACPQGVAATESAGSPHDTVTSTKGSLNDGGLTVTVNMQGLNGDSSNQLIAGTEYTLLLSGQDFKGFLFRVNSTSTSVISPNNAAVCQSQSAVGATHTENSLKSNITATLRFDQTGFYVLDVTVVILYQFPTSEYYYTGYSLEVVDGILMPTTAPSTLAPTHMPSINTTSTPTTGAIAPISPTAAPTHFTKTNSPSKADSPTLAPSIMTTNIPTTLAPSLTGTTTGTPTPVPFVLSSTAAPTPGSSFLNMTTAPTAASSPVPSALVTTAAPMAATTTTAPSAIVMTAAPTAATTNSAPTPTPSALGTTSLPTTSSPSSAGSTNSTAPETTRTPTTEGGPTAKPSLVKQLPSFAPSAVPNSANAPVVGDVTPPPLAAPKAPKSGMASKSDKSGGGSKGGSTKGMAPKSGMSPKSGKN